MLWPVVARVDSLGNDPRRALVLGRSCCRRLLLAELCVEEFIGPLPSFFGKCMAGVRIVCTQPLRTSVQAVDRAAGRDHVAHAADVEIVISLSGARQEATRCKASHDFR